MRFPYDRIAVELEVAMTDSTQLALQWHSPKDPPFHLAGFAWFDKERIYRRLPVNPAHPVRPEVDSLANSTAGGQIRFQTDSPRLWLRVNLKGPGTMDHMPATGQCGFDCYLGSPGQQRYRSTTRFDHTKNEYECALFENASREMRSVTLNYPLYQGVDEVLVGLDSDAEVLPPAPYQRAGRVIVYGTSITQGGCANRPGMAYTNILSRRINLEFINLGFSGNGRGEPEMAHNIAEIEHPACVVLDHEANSGESLRDTLPEFLRILREAHSQVPILIVSRPRFAAENFDESSRQSRLALMEFQKGTVQALRDQGDERIFFHDGVDLLGEDFDECTVDSVHPTDLGFLRMADALEPVLEGILNR